MVKDEQTNVRRSRPRRPVTEVRNGPLRVTSTVPGGNSQVSKPTAVVATSARSRNGSAPPSARLAKSLPPGSASRPSSAKKIVHYPLAHVGKQAPKAGTSALQRKDSEVQREADGQRSPPPTPAEHDVPIVVPVVTNSDAVSDIIDTERSKADVNETSKRAASLDRPNESGAGRSARSRSRSRSPSGSRSRSPKREIGVDFGRKLDESAEYGPSRRGVDFGSRSSRLDDAGLPNGVQDTQEADELSRLLIDAEVDAQAVDIQLGALKDALVHMRNERFLTTTEWNVVNAIRENCVLKMTAFERSTRALRLVIRGRQRIELSATRVAEQRDVLANKLGISDSRLEAARIACAEKDDQIEALKRQLNVLNDELHTVERLRDHSEDTRAHLQKQYRLKEAECDRLAVQIRDMHAFVSGSGGEIEKHRKMYDELTNSLAADKEQLKRATKAYKERAARLEHELEAVNEELKQRDALLRDLQGELTDARVKYDRAARECAQADSELATTRARCEQFEVELSKRNTEVEATSRREQEAKSEASSAQAEKAALQERLTQAESRASDAQRELETTRAKLSTAQQSASEYERRVAAYERELRETMTEAARLSRSLRTAEHEHVSSTDSARPRDAELDVDSRQSAVRFGSTFETSDTPLDPEDQPHRARSESVGESRTIRLGNEPLHARAGSVDATVLPLQDVLRNSSESILRDANDRVAAAHRRVRDQELAFVDSQTRGEQLAAQNAALRDRVRAAHDETRVFEHRLVELEKRLFEADQREAELRTALTRSEAERVARNTSVDEVRRENAALAKQLEHALGEARRAGELARDKFAIRERTLQQRVGDLEKQVATLRTENARSRRERDELERRLGSETRDLRDRLEQTQHTNRALQSYVSFLKHSAAQQNGMDEFRLALSSDSARMSALPGLLGATEFGKQFGLTADARPPSSTLGRFDPAASFTQPTPLTLTGKSDVL